MTNNSNERLDRIEQIQESNARAIAALTENMNRGFETLTENINNLTENVNNLTSDVNRVLARSAILDEIVLDMHSNRQREEA